MTFLCGKEMEKKCGGLHPCACFGLFGRKGTRRLLIALRRQTQPIKSKFLYTFVNCIKVYMKLGRLVELKAKERVFGLSSPHLD